MPREKNPASHDCPEARAPQDAPRPADAAPTFDSFVDPEQRAALIAEAAFFRAEKRGFAPGHEVEDWLAAEAEVDAEAACTRPNPARRP